MSTPPFCCQIGCDNVEYYIIEFKHIQRCKNIVQCSCILESGGVQVISIKDYAKSKNVSYEAVRKQINRYRKELDNHIQKVGRTQYLDETAIAFLDEKRKANPVVVFESNKDEEIERLKEENKNLLLKVMELQDQLLKEKECVQRLQEEQITLLEEKSEQQETASLEPDPAEGKHWWQFWK